MSTTTIVSSYAAIILIGIFPILSVMLCAALANYCGCRADESKVHPCKCHGVEIGGFLYTAGVMGWLMLVTLPIAGILLVLFTLRLLIWG
ncbi:hypothetical protein [Lewinella sp. 4G2]|uniref:hypothetical protein n=1 Tax=Lewinella sp. 4G2 TaxID=1803372 RepID=UPI0007B496D5|nr:hypothetical protein [Lewinella sp. 4G2]OAV44821.1 hypothetical protein A3850_010115 [Lewinella sp. 4G2]